MLSFSMLKSFDTPGQLDCDLSVAVTFITGQGFILLGWQLPKVGGARVSFISRLIS